MKRLGLKEAKDIFVKRYFVGCIIGLLICWFMKLWGIGILELDLNNKLFNDMDMFFSHNYWLLQAYYSTLLIIQVYLMHQIVNREDKKKALKYVLLTSPLSIGVRVLTSIFEAQLGMFAALIEMIYMVLLISKVKPKKILSSVVTVILLFVYQVISVMTNSLTIQSHTYGFIVSQLLSIDFYIMLILTKEVSFMNDGTWFLFGLTAWIYGVAGFIWGIIWGIFAGPVIKAKQWYAKGKAKEDARKAKKSITKVTAK